MSGVAKDDPISDPASDKTATVGEAEAKRAEESAAVSESEGKPGRKGAPHLRVVTGDAATDFVSELPPQEPAPTPDVLPNQRIGAAIRARREMLGHSLDQASKETRVHLSHLRAIEEMTPNLLGAPVYAKGYIRAYARFLGLDEISTLERYLRECAILKDPEKQEIAPPTAGRSLPAAVPVLGFLIVALIGAAAAAFFLNNSGQKSAGVAAKPEAAAPGVAAPPAADVSAPTQQLRVVALRPSLLEVRSADGTKFVRREFQAGEGYTVRVGASWTVSVQDGTAFEWRLGDKSLGRLGDTPTPLNAVSVDLAATRPPVEAPAATPELTDAEKAAIATPSGAAPSAATPTGVPPATAAAPAPAKPKPRPKPQAPPPAAAPETGQAQAAAAPPAQPAQPAAPAQDPALAAYPNQ